MNRRSFIADMLKAGMACSFLPGAGRIWKPVYRPITLGDMDRSLRAAGVYVVWDYQHPDILKLLSPDTRKLVLSPSWSGHSSECLCADCQARLSGIPKYHSESLKISLT